MQFVLVIHESPEHFDRRTSDPDQPYIAAWRSYYQSLVDAGVYVVGRPLQAVDQTTIVRVKAGRRQLQDGPYAETKEQLGGFIVLELSSLDEALDWAARCPVASGGAVEVRPVAVEVHDAIVG